MTSGVNDPASDAVKTFNQTNKQLQLLLRVQ